MPISVETQKWLDDMKAQGELSDDQFKTLSEVVGIDKVDSFVSGSVLRQEDYSKHMNDLKTRRETQDKEHQDRLTTVKTYETDLQKWKKTSEAEIKATSQSKTELEQRLADLQSTVRAKAVEFGLDPKDILSEADLNPKPAPVPAPNPAAVPAFDMEALKKDYLPRSEFDTVAQGNLQVTALIHDIAVEHKQLTGEDIKTETLLQGALGAKKPLREFWEDTHNIAQKRTDVAEAARKEHDEKIRADAVAETETRLISEGYTPKPQPGSQLGSPVLGADMKPPPEPKPDEFLSDVQRKNNRVQAGVAAYQENLAAQGPGQ